jgi:DNA-binding NarL/FixJ family response regulator
MSEEAIRIGIVDSHVLIRKALRFWLSQYKEIHVVVETGESNELLKRLEDSSPIDVLILDVHRSFPNSKEALNLLKHRFPQVKTVILSNCIEPETVNEYLELGILGYVSKSAYPAELLAAIRSAGKHVLFENPVLTRALYWRANANIKTDVQQDGTHFTEKQKKILELLWQEKTTQEISDEVFLSVSAVDKIKQQLKEKTGARTTIGLLKFAIERKIIKPQYPINGSDTHIQPLQELQKSIP